MVTGAKFKSLFQPGNIGRLTLSNRIIMAPMVTRLSTDTGAVSDRMILYYMARAIGGAALLIVEATCVDAPLGLVLPGELRINEDKYIPGHDDLTEAIHSYGSKIALQIHHAGWRADPRLTENMVPVAPSPVAMSGAAWRPRELGVTEIEKIIDKFVEAAVRARLAGYDAVEIHGASHYLVHQFMSPYTNRRTDLYGGSLENRMRFPTEIIKRIKTTMGSDFPVIFRFTADENHDEGYTIEEAKLFVKFVEAAGADALHVSTGLAVPEEKDGVARRVCPASFPQGWAVPYAEVIKQEVRIPVITVGVIREPEFAERVLSEGKADFIALGRGLLADPEWPRKAAEGRVEDIRKCISCNYCRSRLSSTSLRCAINVEVGREKDFAQIKRAAIKKKVMVVGAGPAGMEAARIAALRGHRVSLFEKEKSLAHGQIRLASAIPEKDKINWLRDYLTTQVKKLNIDVHLGVEVTSSTVAKVKPEVLIIATGARPMIPDIPGISKANVVHAHDVLGGKLDLAGQRVVVLGGRLTGCETAMFLAQRNCKVTIVARSPKDQLAEGALDSNRPDLLLSLQKHNVEIVTEHDVKEITDGGIIMIDKNWKGRFLEVDAVVVARGVVPVRELASKLEADVTEVYAIGDCVKPRDFASAIYEGGLIARRI